MTPQAVADGVDILVLSIGPDEPPEDTVTFLGIFDIAMLFARKAGVFVVQAAGNQGPGPSTVVSYSPWTVGAASSRTDRRYTGSVNLGNGQNVLGVGLSGKVLYCQSEWSVIYYSSSNLKISVLSQFADASFKTRLICSSFLN